MHEELIQTVRETIEKSVNGKIDKLATEVRAIHDRLDKQDIAIAPALETIQTFQSGRKFMVWALPIFAFVGAVIAWIKS